MLKKLIPYLPQSWQEKIIRKLIQFPTSIDSDYVVKIAQTKEELEAAYKLLHDCYVKQGLMDEHPSGLRCNLYTLLPETTTIIAKYKGQTVGTVAIIKDGRLGLPSDTVYLQENNSLRARGEKLLEASSLAVDSNFRQTNHSVSFLLMKYLTVYSKQLECTTLVITVHPRAKPFYKSLFKFTKLGKIVTYGHVNNALATFLYMPLGMNHFLDMASGFKSEDPKRNAALWIQNLPDPRFKYPKLVKGQILSPVLTPELIEHFFFKKTDLLSTLSHEKKIAFFEVLTHFFGSSRLQKLAHLYHDLPLKEFRYPVSIKASAEINLHFHILTILDISTNGSYVEVHDDQLIHIKKGDAITLRFNLNNSSFVIKGFIRWLSKKTDDVDYTGFGVQFEKSVVEINEELQSFGKNKTVKIAA